MSNFLLGCIFVIILHSTGALPIETLLGFISNELDVLLDRHYGDDGETNALKVR